jgi:hypothetical protein
LTGTYNNADGWYIDHIAAGQLQEHIINAYDFSSQWNMISIPLKIQDYGKDIVFPNATSNAFTYANQYITQDTLRCGKGYWIKFDSTETITFSGEIVRKDTIDVYPGWNMIGSISFPVDISTITSIPSSNVISDYYAYIDNSYSSSQSIEPGKGYWVKVVAPGKLVLSSFNIMQKIDEPAEKSEFEKQTDGAKK